MDNVSFQVGLILGRLSRDSVRHLEECLTPSIMLIDNRYNFERLFAMTTQLGCKKSEGYLDQESMHPECIHTSQIRETESTL